MTDQATTNNNAVATTKAVEIKTVKPAGIKRIKHAGTAGKYVANFNAGNDIETGKAIKQAATVLPLLVKATDKLTSFGHKAYNDDVKALTAIIDNHLIDTAKTQVIDVQAMVNECFTCYTTTSRCSHLPALDQVAATLKKISDHLACFNTAAAAYDKYLSKRLATAGYTPATGKNLIDGFSGIAHAYRQSIMAGSKAVRQAITARDAKTA